MASIIPNFEYDIFISYRHKDNKGDHWVTEFVSALKTEIEATFKEDISIYFDANPHDGLLETHDVDDSLKDKLKCLIFIPIISRTYCDPKSFAWNQEFLPFLKMAAGDSYGLKVKLPNGNTASRVLPIRIHELDVNDKGMIETELQGVLRAIDFTYKAAGINRPLLSKDDEAIKTSGQATYRDQINKTANAICDIIYGIQGKSSKNAGGFHDEQTLTSSASVLAKKKNWKQRFPFLGKLTWSHSVATVSTLLLFVLAIIHYSETNNIPTYKTTILPPDKTKFDTSRGSSFALSPDGTKLAFVTLDSAGKSLLYVRSLNTLIAKPLNGTEGAQRPFWSPDSRFIGFFADRKLKKIDITGGSVLTLFDDVQSGGGSWNQDGVILFPSATKICRVSENGGKFIRVTQIDTTRVDNHLWPLFLPDGKHFLFTSRNNFFGAHEDDAIFVASLDSTFIPKLLVKASSNMAYANGHLIYYDGERLVAQLFDANKLSVSGSPIPIGDQIFFEPQISNAAFSVSQNGLLVYQSGLQSSGRHEYVWRNREGSALDTISSISGLLFRLSPDEERIAVIKEPNSKKEGTDIWLHEINRKVWTRFTFGPNNSMPIWSPDSKAIAYTSSLKENGADDIYLKRIDGAGTAEVILKSKESIALTDWSRDGKFITYFSDRKYTGSNDIWIVPVKASGDKTQSQPFPFLQTEFNEAWAVFSPDGRWIAYHSNESGRDEIYVRPFPGPGGKWQVSTNGGTNPKWRGDGKELFFKSENNVMSVEIKTSETSVTVGAEQKLFRVGSRMVDATNDGQKFLMLRAKRNDYSLPMTLVVNWLEELKKAK